MTVWSHTDPALTLESQEIYSQLIDFEGVSLDEVVLLYALLTQESLQNIKT